jgi:phosphoserine phosphatase RsbU/P
MLMLFTDGLYEVQDTNAELFSQALLTESVQKRLSLPAARIFDELLAEVKRFSNEGAFTDDVCLVAMDYRT